MVFKINLSDKGKCLKLETDSESLIRTKIGDRINGESFSPELAGYEIEITGTSDISGFPGIKGQPGHVLRKVLLVKGDKGMRTVEADGLRLKKSVRGEEISEKTVQINMKVIKEGKKKFAEILPKKEEAGEKKEAESKEKEEEESGAKQAEKKE